MYKDNNFLNGKKKIEVLKDKIPALKRTNKPDEVFAKQKQLFHLCISFSYVLFVKKNSVDFNKFMNYASQTLSSMVQKRHAKFSVNWKKQITYFLLCSLVYYRSNTQKKFSLTCLHEAQRICSNLTCEEPRHYDYVLATNTFTAFMLIKVGQVEEALDFLNIAEKVLKKIIDYSVSGKLTEKQQKWHDFAQEMHSKTTSDKGTDSPRRKRQVRENGGDEMVTMLTSQNSQPIVESISEEDEERPLAKIKIKKKFRNPADEIFSVIGPCPSIKPSRLSIAQIQNYMLSISIMKTIALKHANIITKSIDDEEFEIKFGQQIEWLVDLDSQISQVNQMPGQQAPFSEINISYLVAQHYKEMVEGSYDLKSIIRQSFDPAFVSMLCGSMFEPLLSKETPDKNLVLAMTKREVANSQEEKYAFNPDSNEIQNILDAREKLIQTIYSEAFAKRQLLREAQERHKLVQEQIDKKNALLQKNRPESVQEENRFFSTGANFVPVDIAQADKQFSGAGSIALSGTGSIKSGQEGGPIAHLNLYGPSGAEQELQRILHKTITTPQNTNPVSPGYVQGSVNIPLSPQQREIQRILQSQQSPKAGYSGPFSPSKSIIKYENGRSINASRHSSTNGTNTNRRVQIVESLPLDRDVIGATFDRSPAIKQADYANEPVLVNEIVPNPIPIIRKERVRTSPHGPISIRRTSRTYDNRDQIGQQDHKIGKTADLRIRDISAEREREIENQIQQVIIEKEGSQAAKTIGGPISPLDEIKEHDYDLVQKKIKTKSQTREEARPRRREQYSRPDGVPQLNLNSLKNESAQKPSAKGSVIDSKQTSEKRVNFSQKQQKPFVRGLAKLATKTQYNESKRSPRAMLIQKQNKAPYNDNRDISVYSGAQKLTPQRKATEHQAESDNEHNSSIEQFNNSFKQSTKNNRTGSMSKPRAYSRPSNHRVIQNVYLKAKEPINSGLFENSIIEQSPRLGQEQRKITDDFSSMGIRISPRDYGVPVSNQNYAAVKLAMELNYQKLQQLQKQGQLRIKRDFENDLKREKAKRKSEQPRTSPRVFKFNSTSIQENSDLNESKEQSQQLSKRTPRQGNLKKKKFPQITATQTPKDGVNIHAIQKDIFENSDNASPRSDNGQLDYQNKSTGLQEGHEIGVQVDDLRENSVPSVNITIGMQTPLERSVDYMQDSESHNVLMTDTEQAPRQFDYAQHMAIVKAQKMRLSQKNSNRLSPRQRNYEVYRVTRTKVETPGDHMIRRINNASQSRNDDRSQISGIDSLYGSSYRNERPQRLPDVRGLGSQGGKPRHKIVSQRPKIEIPKKYKEMSRAIHEQSLTDHSVVIENSQELPTGEEQSVIAQSRIFDTSEPDTLKQQSRTHTGPFYMHRSSAVESAQIENQETSLNVNQDLPGKQSGTSETLIPKPSLDESKSKKGTSPFKNTPKPFRIERRIPETQKMQELRSLSVKQPRVLDAVEMAYKYNQRHSIFKQTKFGADPLPTNRSNNRSNDQTERMNQKILKPLRLETLPSRRKTSVDQRLHNRPLNLTKKEQLILKDSPQQNNINERQLMQERSQNLEKIDKIMKSLNKSEFSILNQHPKMSAQKINNYGGPHIDRYEKTQIIGRRKVDMSFAQSSSQSKVDFEKLMKGVPPPQNFYKQ